MFDATRWRDAAAFSAATEEDLAALKRETSELARPMLARHAELNEEERATLRELHGFAVAAKTELETRAAKRAEADAERASIAGTFSAIDDENKAATPPATPPAAPAAPAAAPAAPAPAATATATAEPTFALPRAGDLAQNAPAVNPGGALAVDEKTLYGSARYLIKPTVASTGEFGKLKLDEFSGMRQLGGALTEQVRRYNGLQGTHRDPLIEFVRDYPAEYRVAASPSEVGDPGTEFALLTSAVDKYKAENANQTAAAAYCAPSLTIYDLCELETSTGMLPITEIQISRGGIFFTTGPDFASIFNGSGYWNYTEAQIIANTTKPCMEIDCPAFTEKRLRNLGMCVTAGILQRRGFPELIARFLRGVMVAHLHLVNAFVISEMAAGSTLVDLDPIPAGSLVGDVTSSGLLAAAEMVATDMRYRNRMDPAAMLEAVFPVWALAQIRADLSRRTGVDLVSVTDAQITQFFSDRHLTLRLVYDWQDAFSGVAGGPGTAAPGITSFASAIEFMIYPPGTWAKGVDETIRLETVYDSAKLSTNQYTALFSEEGVLVAKTCPDSRRVIYTMCPTGATSDLVARTCL
jgi:hypothetical protein